LEDQCWKNIADAEKTLKCYVAEMASSQPPRNSKTIKFAEEKMIMPMLIALSTVF